MCPVYRYSFFLIPPDRSGKLSISEAEKEPRSSAAWPPGWTQKHPDAAPSPSKKPNQNQESEMKTKTAESLERGDKVFTKDGEPVTVRETSNGLYRNSVLVEFTNGKWACVLRSEEVELRS